MSTKPSDLPTWATDGGADIVEPNAGKQALGHRAGERPPAQYFNWWQNLVFQWIEWIDQILEHTFTHQISPFSGMPAVRADDWDRAAGASYVSGADASGWLIPLPVKAGDRITEIRAYIQDNLGIAMTVGLYTGSTTGTDALVADEVSAGAGGADQTLTFAAVNHTVDGTKHLYLLFEPDGGALTRVYYVEMDVDRP